MWSIHTRRYSVQFSLCRVWLFATSWTAAGQGSLSITKPQSLLKLMPTESVMPSNHLILCCPLLPPPSIFPSMRVFSNVSVLHIRWPKYWSFSFSISPSNEHSGLISFRMHWLDLLAVQGTLKGLLQHHSSKASILWCSAFSNSHIHTCLLEKSELWLDGPLLAKLCLCFLVLFLRGLYCFPEWQCQFTFQLTVHKHSLFYTFSPILDVSFRW